MHVTPSTLILVFVFRWAFFAFSMMKSVTSLCPGYLGTQEPVLDCVDFELHWTPKTGPGNSQVLKLLWILGDKIGVMVNNFGGTSQLELYVVAREAVQYLSECSTYIILHFLIII